MLVSNDSIRYNARSRFIMFVRRKNISESISILLEMQTLYNIIWTVLWSMLASNDRFIESMRSIYFHG